MSVHQFPIEELEIKNNLQEVSHVSNNNISKNPNCFQKCELGNHQVMLQNNLKRSSTNIGNKCLNDVIKHTQSIASLIASPNKIEGYDDYLISPFKEYKYKESAFTPIKNDSSLLFTPLMKLEVHSASPFEKLEYSSGKKGKVIKGKFINFNNIEISSALSLSHHDHDTKDLVIENNPSFIHSHGNRLKIRCTCTKTSCQKKYCACYANGKYCENCECVNCENKGINKGNELNKSLMNRICNCTKSNCTKKYCECFKRGKNCSNLCRCINCINLPPLIDENISKGNYDMMFDKIKKEMNNIDNNQKNYWIEGIGIEIKNNKILIIHRKINTQTKLNNEAINNNDKPYTPMKVLGKKRNQGKIQSTKSKKSKMRTNYKTNRKIQNSF